MHEHIEKVGGKWRLVSKKTGKNLGTFASKTAAEKREMQVNYFKHTEESFDSLVAELMRKGYSKDYATKIAGKVAAEKGETGHKESLNATEAADVLSILIDKLHQRKDKDATQEEN